MNIEVTIFYIIFIYIIYVIVKSILRGFENISKIPDNSSQLKTRATAIIKKHKRELAIQRKQMVYIDPFGNEDKSKWQQKGMPYFIRNIIIPKLPTNELDHSLLYITDKENNKLYEGILRNIGIEELIEVIVKPEMLKLERENINNGYRSDMTGFEYEVFCKTKLEEIGWGIVVTKKTGDQGVDLIATKKKRKVAIQCKKYSSPVGNKAVQEVVAGKLYYNLDSAVVITNRSFTKSAEQLAKANAVQLIHHNEIDKI